MFSLFLIKIHHQQTKICGEQVMCYTIVLLNFEKVGTPQSMFPTLVTPPPRKTNTLQVNGC